MTNYSITLPFPPSSNRYWRNVNGRMVKSAAARAYRDEAGWRSLSQNGRQRPLTGNVKVSMDLYRPARRGDLDNRIKILLDSLEGIAFENDSQIIEIHARQFEDKLNPRVWVVVTSNGAGE